MEDLGDDVESSVIVNLEQSLQGDISLDAIQEFSHDRLRNNFGTYWCNLGIFIAV